MEKGSVLGRDNYISSKMFVKFAVDGERKNRYDKRRKLVEHTYQDEELLGIEKESCIMYTQEITANNEVGLHARPATFFIQKANEFKSGIWVEKDDRRVNAKSLLGVLSLGIVKGTTITLIADGSDEKEAVGALVDLVKDNFGE